MSSGSLSATMAIQANSIPTPYQLIQTKSKSQNGQGQLEVKDKEAIDKHWLKAFYDDTTSNGIFTAIRTKVGGSSDALAKVSCCFGCSVGMACLVDSFHLSLPGLPGYPGNRDPIGFHP